MPTATKPSPARTTISATKAADTSPATSTCDRSGSPKDWSGAWWAPWYTLRKEQYPKRVPPWTYDGREVRDWRRARESEDQSED